MALLAALSVVAAGLSCSADPAGKFSTDPDLPNLILITADDLGWKGLSSTGNENVSTPNIDRLAREGVRFSHAFVAASSCAPSRASLITGQYPHTNGVTGLTHIHPTKSLSPFHRTLPELLREAGFNTALQGKWHVSPYLPTSWYGYNERLSGMLPQGFWTHDSTKAIDFIRRNRNNRFYLELNFMQNHRDADGEFHVDAGFPVDSDAIRVPEYWTLPDWPEIREDAAGYFSQTMKMDELVGELLQALDDLQLAENTMVIFVSDNGPPYPGNKMTLYDRGTGTPLLVRWPRKLPAGRVLDQLVSTIDIMPTMLEAAGTAKPDDIQGRSLVAMMEGDVAAAADEVVFSEMTHHIHYLPSRAVRSRRWKYIENYSDIAVGLDQNHHDDWAHRLCELPNQPWKRPRPEEELYDLAGDPDEQVNLAAEPEYAQQLQAMRTLLRQHMVATQDPFLDAPFTYDHDPKAYERD
ncbi:MAG: sulfatase [Deltaproteobacteria bacterium]|nr:sulfatase [Deltaproteobacteria bacterium]